MKELRELSRDSPVGIAGAGAMGAGIAQVAAAAGHSVRLYDTRLGAAAEAVAGVRRMLLKLSQKGKLSGAAAAEASARLQAVESLGDFTGCGLIVEAIVEDLAVKQSLWSALDGVVEPDCLLATNTSSLSLAAIAGALRAPERLVGMHFFNPAPLMDLVEVVAGPGTDAAALAAVEATARAWGKTTVRAQATPGFIVNRVARPYYAEGLRLLAEGAAMPATLDAVLREAGGFRMGPFELTDLIGQDVNFATTQGVWNGCFGDPRFRPSQVQQHLVEMGWLGRKSGRGFYTYGDGAVPPAPATEPAVGAPARLTLLGTGAGPDALAARLAAAGVEIAREGNSAPILALSDGRTAAEREAAHGQPCAVADLALDYAQAMRLALARSPQCGDHDWRAAVGALQAAGIAVSRLRDLPALAVLRTVAMLVNEAADAVHFGVASPADVDTAMRKGVNYPLGPLAWGDSLGVEFVAGVLRHLAAFYGEERYRLSPGIRYQLWSGGRLRD